MSVWQQAQREISAVIQAQAKRQVCKEVGVAVFTNWSAYNPSTRLYRTSKVRACQAPRGEVP